jgi:glutamate/tyrosine decarboxylase-like PLP-dependent enzyme
MQAVERERLLRRELPSSGLAPDAILDLFREEILIHPMGNGHPRFFGWVNSPPAPIGIVAELLSAAMNPSCAGGDHAAIYVERAVVRWLADLVGFPLEPSGMGLLVSGGSMASLTCLAAARHQAAVSAGWNEREEGMQGRERPPLVLYLSEQGHACMRKAAELLGIGSQWVRVVPTNAQFQMDVSALCELVKRDREMGRLRDTFSLVPAYLRTEQGKGFGGLPWFSEYGFQQTRGFRALKLWMVMQFAGRAGLQALVVRQNALARHLSELITAERDLELLTPITLSVVCFRYAPLTLHAGEERLNSLNKSLMEALQAEGKTFVSGTTLRDSFALRACVLHFDTTEDDLAVLVRSVRETGERLMKAGEWKA